MQRSGIETGTVVKTERSLAEVIINKSKSCKECGKAQAGICGKSGAGMVMQASNGIGAKEGDTVVLGLKTATHAKAYFIFFLLPVIALFISAYIGYLVSQSTDIKGLDVLGGLSGLVISIAYSLYVFFVKLTSALLPRSEALRGQLVRALVFSGVTH
jgi:positive regulator of sigma E activity